MIEKLEEKLREKLALEIVYYTKDNTYLIYNRCDHKSYVFSNVVTNNMDNYKVGNVFYGQPYGSNDYIWFYYNGVNLEYVNRFNEVKIINPLNINLVYKLKECPNVTSNI